MIKAIIIDDEKKARETISSIIKLYCPTLEIIAEAGDIKTAETLIAKHKPDLIFLDVDMPGGSGFELLKRYADIPFKIIFITAHQEHAIKAFKFSALDYLLKPLDPEDLMSAVAKAEEAIGKDKLNVKLEVFMSAMENQSREPKKIVLKTSDNIHVVNVSDIIRCQADGNYSSFFLPNKKTILVSNTLKEYDELLVPHRFFRVHQSHLVNLDQIERYEKKDGGCLIMKDGSVIPVAVRKKEDLLSLLQGI